MPKGLAFGRVLSRPAAGGLDRMTRVLALISRGVKPSVAAREVLGTKATSRRAARHGKSHARRGKRAHRRAAASKPAAPLQMPQSVLPGTPAGDAPAPQPSGSAAQPSGPAGTLLEYLLGGGG